MIENLRKNKLACKSDLFIFSDGPKNHDDAYKVSEVRRFLKNISGFKNIEIAENRNNSGLARSVIDGVSSVIKKYKKIIVLEDDLIPSSNFLEFMNQALEYYESNNCIFSVSGYTPNLPSLQYCEKDFYLGHRASSWGWGTWNDRWEKVDWEVTDYKSFKFNIKSNLKFARGGSDLPFMLNKQMQGKIDSWAIRWCYNQYKMDQLTIFPTKSKITNIGFSSDATHTKKNNRFLPELDSTNQDKFLFEAIPTIDKTLAKEFKSIFSFKERLKSKILK